MMFGNRIFYNTDFSDPRSDDRIRVPAAMANVVSSETEQGTHLPILDLDFPAVLLPSSTEGHFHLYLQREVEWSKYEKVLDDMKDAGLLQKGYVEHSKSRKGTFLRLPWVKKRSGDPLY